MKEYSARAHIRSAWERLTFFCPPPKNNGYMEVDGVSELSRQPAPTPTEPLVPKVFDDEPVFVIGGREWLAKGKLSEEGFVVFAGSVANDVPKSFEANKVYFPIRRRLEDEGVIEGGVFQRDYTFRSAAQAGCVVASANIQAVKKWHTEPDADGETLTYEECHPKGTGITRREKEARRRRREAEKARREYREEIIRKADAVIDGRAWHFEWRGQLPFRRGGVYQGVVCG